MNGPLLWIVDPTGSIFLIKSWSYEWGERGNLVGVVTGFCPMWENFARPGSLEEPRGRTSLGLSSKTRAEFLACGK